MNYEVSGSGEPMVLITGLGGNISFWHGMVPLLSNRFKVVTFDNRSSGLTESPEGPIDVWMLADDVVALMDHLSITKAHILGWSMGGNIAQVLALRNPERIASLTLVSTYMRRPSRSSYVMNTMVDSVRSGGDIECLFKIMQSYNMTEDAFRKREERGAGTPGRVSATLEQFAAQLAAVDKFDSRRVAKDIRVPTRVIHGMADIMVPYRLGEELAAEIEGSDMVLIDTGGHTMPPRKYVGPFLEHVGKYPIT